MGRLFRILAAAGSDFSSELQQLRNWCEQFHFFKEQSREPTMASSVFGSGSTIRGC
jgi:hypothetical protein